jgi:translocation and assembly module TamB
MAGAADGSGNPPEPAAALRPRRNWRRYAVTRAAGLMLLLVVGLLAAILVLDSQIGHRFVIDRIADLGPRSGLRIEIGRIEGSLYSRARLRGVVLKDPDGTFMTVPEAELDWRPLSWLGRGLDIRELILRRGILLRRPRLRPGDPDSPILPQFDIRIDRLAFENLTIAEPVIGTRRRIDLSARADVRKGRLLLAANGRLGGSDRLIAYVDAEPDRDRLALRLDYQAPRGGLLAGLAGARSDIRARIGGRGGWNRWDGSLYATRDGSRLAAFLLSNRGGRFGVLGEAYPGDLAPASARKAIGRRLALAFSGTFVDSRVAGKLSATAEAFRLNSGGTVDFAGNRFDALDVKAVLTRPELILADPQLDGVRLAARLDGPFRDVSIRHQVTVRSLRTGTLLASDVRTAGNARWTGGRLVLPLDLTAGGVVTGNPQLDQRLAGAQVRGDLLLAGSRLSSDNLKLDVRGAMARLALRADLSRAAFALAGPVSARGFALPNLGLVEGEAKIVFRSGAGVPWLLRANAAGRMSQIDNPTLASIAGSAIRFTGGFSMGRNAPLLVRDARLTSPRLALTLDGERLANGRTTLRGGGRHADYGPFTVEAAIGPDGPSGVLVFASPYPAADLSNVRVALAPIAQGFRIETSGGSRLGPFEGTVNLFASPGGPTRLAIERLTVSQTQVSGELLVAGGGVSGELALAGGGVNGTLRIDPREGGQAIAARLTADNARFGGPVPLSVARGRLEATGLLVRGRTTLDATLSAEGIASGKLFIGRLAARASLVNGSGTATVSLTGRRGSRFQLAGTGQFSPDRIAVLASGFFADERITMPRRAVLTRERDSWRLAPAQIGYAGGVLIASGLVLGPTTDLELKLARMPLSLGDVLVADLGLGGVASGIVEYRAARGEVPTGSARILVKGLTRSGLVLSSRPVDLAFVARLEPRLIQARAVVEEQGEVRGRLQARIVGLPAGGALTERLRAGTLFAQVRYDGPADALWRQTGVEIFDLTGPLTVAADITGSIDDPRVTGMLASSNLRLRSALTGTDLRQIAVRGQFQGPRLVLTGFSGVSKDGGRIGGSGSIDLSGLGTRGPGIDLRLAARDALLIDRDDMAARVTGPLRVVSDGNGGTIAGRLAVGRGRWQLGRAVGPAALPIVRTRETNLRADVAPPKTPGAAWNYLIDARAPGRVDVRGLGLDSEWSADIRLRGTTADPQLFGSAQLVRGGYEFAGKRFELSRGNIRFSGERPPDPQLDIVAEDDVEGLSARITIGGTASLPEIAFSSTPAMPEEELLSRILFGTSVTDISAVEALQLGAAVASLRGGEGMDPINRLRSAIGLDRLRVIGADPTLGRGTSIAVGKYLGRRFFVEIVTDGQGYSATQIEYRITRWLALLSSISTIGDESLNVRVSKDY